MPIRLDAPGPLTRKNEAFPCLIEADLVTFAAVKLIRKDTDYALVALVRLARLADNSSLSAAQLATDLVVPHGFLRKILKTLSNHGIVKSTRGKMGGFRLARTPASITVLHVLEIFQGKIRATDCVVADIVCTRKDICQLHGSLRGVEQKLSKELKRITIAMLANPQPKRRHE
ncbi:MAG: Rrf2 family transcriptional regulator [Lentisphaerales bacterium]|jgi:Rrf2 family protein|nr:MAG: Rrf2 family transcriptional regulator [Lentisphaerales bacterium]